MVLDLLGSYCKKFLISTAASSRVLDLCLQLELSLSSLEELESLWAAIPPEQHRAWGTRLESLVVHGSPTWRVYRVTSLSAEALSGLEVDEAADDARYMLDWKGDKIKLNPGDKLPGIL
ncbi:hypothetical protein QBZ16_004471 [Prototheca wickerhamii]|uniref:Uncharacterized protein n=1 Tax=Prototheca wickerhamii TaxID=3111 RepID=A0AAD9MK77_PROWI|nr:hypothetical protein QBZ16_004471 [Prototheca wickerhamii]